MQVFTVNESVANKRRFYLFLVDATDGITPETGEAGGQPEISINGGVYASTSSTLEVIGNGTYFVTLTVAELAALGNIVVRYKSANTIEFQDVGSVQPSGVVSTDDLKRMLTELSQKVNWLEYQLKSGGQEAMQQQDLTVI